MPLFPAGEDLVAVFTQRPSSLRRHAGQISFPGGQAEPQDAGLVATALRETMEEIGLDGASVEVLGGLPPVSVPVSDFAIYPFVGMTERPAGWTLADDEVESVIELPLTPLARSYARRTVTRGEQLIETDTFSAGEAVIWGATARILTDLLTRIELL